MGVSLGLAACSGSIKITERERTHMTSVRLCISILVVVLLVPAVAFATGVTTSSAAGASASAASTSLATVTIPAVIAIDVESNFTFNFNTYPAPSGPTACTDVFPPGADCTSATYTPSITTVSGTAAAGHLWIAIFSNKTGVHTTMTVTAHGPASFSADPGFTPQQIRMKVGTSNNAAVNGATFGLASPTDIGIAASPLILKTGTMTNSVFGWSRIDQIPDLELPGSQTFNVVTGSTADITFTLKY